jgi:hypothetical protein
MPGGSTAGALTHVHTLADVKVPEDLPPEVARELAELVSNRRNTWGRWARDMIPRVLIGAAFAIPSTYYANLIFGLWWFVPVILIAPFPWQTQVYGVLSDRMRELGIGARARRRIFARIVKLVGKRPRIDPDERPSADRVLELLAPQRDRLGEHVDAPALTAVERQRDEVRLAALGYLRTSRISNALGWFFGATFTPLGIAMIMVDEPVVRAFGMLSVFFGGGAAAISSWARYRDTWAAAPHLRFAPRRMWRLWRQIRGAAKRVDKRLPSAERAQAIAALVVEDDVSAGQPP